MRVPLNGECFLDSTTRQRTGGMKASTDLVFVKVRGNSYSVDHVRTDDVAVSELVTIEVAVQYHRAVLARRTTAGPPDYCYGYDPAAGPGLVTLRTVVHLDDLYGAGVTIASGPESPYEISVTLVAVR